ILVEPALPENIGAAARAMKTMGFHSLRLVNPADHLCERARWVAHGSADILEGARVFSNFAEAVDGIDFLIGTTVRKRAFKRHYYAASELAALIKNKRNTIASVGLVFGPEKSGLTSEQLKKCDIVSSVPLRTTFPSLNLAQAVMVYAYSLSPLIVDNHGRDIVATNNEKLTVLKNRVSRLLDTFGVREEFHVYHRILERLAVLSAEDLSLVHFICKKLEGFTEKE
ncbi:tRNA/rRNA methyltransferase, partial [candidate division KSB1 bacterium 4484_87]